jgi:indole-3-glycerol phosphate synthase
VSSGSYLDAIVPDVRRRLAERKARVPQAELERAFRACAPPSFAEALRLPGVAVIAEVKRFSPSKGPIRPDLDVASLVGAYEAGGAAGISVLTEQDHFGGSLDDLREAVSRTRLPILRKDFIIDEYQVHEARALGASAVLLIAALLDDGTIHRLSGLAADLGLDVLLEVHDGREMARALPVEEAVIGVNNRDLRTFAVSLETSLRLAQEVPAGRLLVSESGIRDRADVERLASAGVDAVLVGENLLRRQAVTAAVSSLARPVPVKVRRSGKQAHGEEAG